MINVDYDQQPVSETVTKTALLRISPVNLALSKIWSPRPMSLFIVEILEKKGPMTDIDLLKDLRLNFGEVSFRELNRELMKLELAGILRVSRLTKGKRQVELTGRKAIID
jgi:hypothetical protein